MRVEVRKPDESKKRCDDCGSREGPFHECQFPYDKNGSRSQWIDLCLPCIEAYRQDERDFATVDTFTGGEGSPRQKVNRCPPDADTPRLTVRV